MCLLCVLYSYAPTVVSASSLSTETSDSSPISAAAPTPSVPLDPDQPTTSIQIRLADGTRLVAKFNHSHTVNDIRQYINMYPLYVHKGGGGHCSEVVQRGFGKLH